MLDRETIVEIFNGLLINQESAPPSTSRFAGKPGKFVPFSVMPQSDPWFKNKEWIWKNKDEYKTWKLGRKNL